MPRCKSCGEEIDGYQFENFNQKCPTCSRNSGSQKIISNEIRIKTLEDNKGGLGFLICLLFAVPSGIMVGVLMSEEIWAIPTAIAIFGIQVFLLVLIGKKWSNINKEIKALK